jgi:hypothetical protein
MILGEFKGQKKAICFAGVQCGLNRDEANQFGIVSWGHCICIKFGDVPILAAVCDL